MCVCVCVRARARVFAQVSEWDELILNNRFLPSFKHTKRHTYLYHIHCCSILYKGEGERLNLRDQQRSEVFRYYTREGPNWAGEGEMAKSFTKLMLIFPLILQVLITSHCDPLHSKHGTLSLFHSMSCSACTLKVVELILCFAKTMKCNVLHRYIANLLII